MRILIRATSRYTPEAEDYKPKLKDFKYEEVRDDSGNVNCYIEINSIEDLIKLAEVVEHELILHHFEDETFIEIYDDWRE